MIEGNTPDSLWDLLIILFALIQSDKFSGDEEENFNKAIESAKEILSPEDGTGSRCHC